MTETQTTISCADCEYPLPPDIQPSGPPCPQCGSIYQKVRLDVTEEIAVEANAWLKAVEKDPSRSSKTRKRKELFAGDDLRKGTGVWVHKERIVDRDNDLYRETVRDKETGETIHHCEEPLSAHRGHGSAKIRTANTIASEGAPKSEPDDSAGS